MSKNHRAAILAAWIVAVAFVFSSATQATQADSDGPIAKVTKKAKVSKSAEKKAAEKKMAEKKADAEKAKAEKEYDEDEFNDDSSSSKPAEKAAVKPAKPEEKSAEKPAEKAANKTAKPQEKPANSAYGVATKPLTPTTVVRFSLSGDYPEGPSEGGMFSDLQPSLGKLIERLDEARADKEVRAIWLRIEDMELGRGKVNEVRAAIARIRKAGKPVYAELTSADTGAYLVASACDHVYMPVSGMLIVPGVRMEVTFYKGLLDKLGLKFDALRMGKYKGFVEPMSRENMSAPLRESLQSIVDDTYDDMIAMIAKDRHLQDYQVKSLVDQGLFSATAAQEAGLIDEVLYADEFEESLGKRLKVDRVEIETAYKKKRVDADFSGIGGFVKLMEVFSGGRKSEKSGNKQKIAVVYAVGEITEGKSRNGLFSGSSLGSTTMIETLKKAFHDSKVVAVVLRIDSPGGSATASDLIWRETVRGKKPFVASMGNVAGSGGYYIAMGAKKIFAEPGTITGSIGVGGGKLVTGGLYDKLGLNTEIISRGKNSGALSSAQPFSPDERRVWTQLLKETYHEFVSKAAEGRKMDYNRLESLAQGRVYTGRQAKKLGLIDEVGTLSDAITEAKKLAGLKPDADVEIEILPQPKSFFEQLFNGEGTGVNEFTAAMPDIVKTLRQAALWRQLLSEKVLLWMPYHVELK
ncbi:MAG: signal peptide peptidase SppA [Planctomycetota bacterium]